MTSITAPIGHWTRHADNDRALLGRRHLAASASARARVAAGAARAARPATDGALASLAPVVPIGLLALFMLAVVISPL